METSSPNASGDIGAKGEGLRLKREDVFFFWGGGERGFEN